MLYKKNTVTIYLLIVLFGINQGFSHGLDALDASKKAKGPILIQKNLVAAGVLNSPKFAFTNAYDSEKTQANIKGLFFNGLPFHGKKTKVFCWYGVPKNLKKGEKAPAVVLVHGGGGTAFPTWVQKWTDQGYIAIAIALEGQVPGERIENTKGQKVHPTFSNAGPKRNGFFNEVLKEKLENQWFYHAVADIMLATSLLESFPEVETSKIGITGISWGGILTNVVTGIDHRYAFAIPVYGCAYLQETPLYKRILSTYSKNHQKFYLENWEPSLYIPLQKQPTLFVNGTNDTHFTMNSFTKTYAASLNEKYARVELNMPHGHGPGWSPKEIYSFANSCIKKTEKPVAIHFKSQNIKKEVTYTFTGTVKEAFLYYTTNVADWDKKKYTWIETNAFVSKEQKTIHAQLPKNTVAYFVNTVNQEGLVSSSEMKFLK